MAIVCLPANGSKQKGSGNRLLWPRRSPLASSRDEMLLGARLRRAEAVLCQGLKAPRVVVLLHGEAHLRCREKSAKNFNKLLIAFKWCSEKKR